MSTKTNGATFKRFYDDKTFWPQDDGNTWHEDEYVLVNDAEHEGNYETIPDEAKVSIEGGIVFGPQWEGNEPSFETFFKRWLKLQTTTSIVIECDISKRDAVIDAVKAAGGKVLK